MSASEITKISTFPNDDDGSDESDLSDNFEEFHLNSFLRHKADPNRKYLTKNEADWRIVDSFSDEFKEAMRDVKSTLNVSWNVKVNN